MKAEGSLQHAIEKCFVALFLCVSFLFLQACPKQSGQGHKRFPKQQEQMAEDQEQQVLEDEKQLLFEKEDTPQRRASQRIVEKGVLALQDAERDVAFQHFQNAMNVDPTNGVAYYYAAKVSFEQDEPSQALGFLDKAETLVGVDDYWLKRIDSLRTLVSSTENY